MALSHLLKRLNRKSRTKKSRRRQKARQGSEIAAVTESLEQRQLLSAVNSAPDVNGPVGTTYDDTPTINWSETENASAYEILVYNVNTGQQASHGQNISGTSFTLPTPMVSSRYQVFVRGIDGAGQAGQWSSPFEFDLVGTTTLPGQPRLTGPQGTSNDSTPTISWDATSGASTYEVLLYNLKTGQQALHERDVTGTSLSPRTGLATSRYQVSGVAANASKTGTADRRNALDG